MLTRTLALTTLSIQTAAPTSSVILRDKDEKLEYAD